MRKWNGYYHISVSTGKPEKCHAQSPNTCPFGMDSPHSTSEDEVMEEVQRLGKQESGGVLAGMSNKMTKNFNKKLDNLYNEWNEVIESVQKDDDSYKNLNITEMKNHLDSLKKFQEKYNDLLKEYGVSDKEISNGNFSEDIIIQKQNYISEKLNKSVEERQREYENKFKVLVQEYDILMFNNNFNHKPFSDMSVKELQDFLTYTEEMHKKLDELGSEYWADLQDVKSEPYGEGVYDIFVDVYEDDEWEPSYQLFYYSYSIEDDIKNAQDELNKRI